MAAILSRPQCVNTSGRPDQHIAWNGPLGRMEVNESSIFYKNLNKI